MFVSFVIYSKSVNMKKRIYCIILRTIFILVLRFDISR